MEREVFDEKLFKNNASNDIGCQKSFQLERKSHNRTSVFVCPRLLHI